MLKTQRAKYQMFGRVKSFGAANRALFPEESVAGKTFALLAALVASIEDQIVRWQEAQASGRRVKDSTRQAARQFMRAIAATGRRAVQTETGAHPFRMPEKRNAPELLGAARLFRAEAERRQARFVELGMAPTFLADFDRVIKALEDAVAVQQDSRGTRGMAKAGIEAALAEGMRLVADLDVTVANALVNNPEGLGQWQGARRVDYPTRLRGRNRPAAAPAATEPASTGLPPTAPSSQATAVASDVGVEADGPKQELRRAS